MCLSRGDVQWPLPDDDSAIVAPAMLTRSALALKVALAHVVLPSHLLPAGASSSGGGSYVSGTASPTAFGGSSVWGPPGLGTATAPAPGLALGGFGSAGLGQGSPFALNAFTSFNAASLLSQPTSGLTSPRTTERLLAELTLSYQQLGLPAVAPGPSGGLFSLLPDSPALQAQHTAAYEMALMQQLAAMGTMPALTLPTTTSTISGRTTGSASPAFPPGLGPAGTSIGVGAGLGGGADAGNWRTGNGSRGSGSSATGLGAIGSPSMGPTLAPPSALTDGWKTMLESALKGDATALATLSGVLGTIHSSVNTTGAVGGAVPMGPSSMPDFVARAFPASSPSAADLVTLSQLLASSDPASLLIVAQWLEAEFLKQPQSGGTPGANTAPTGTGVLSPLLAGALTGGSSPPAMSLGHAASPSAAGERRGSRGSSQQGSRQGSRTGSRSGSADGRRLVLPPAAPMIVQPPVAPKPLSFAQLAARPAPPPPPPGAKTCVLVDASHRFSSSSLPTCTCAACLAFVAAAQRTRSTAAAAAAAKVGPPSPCSHCCL
jgi:hypothetical protein